jgi:crotonobetainyl-CoA:carnitine CoA-transferase CaiB-like acyl-CoA transferase
MVGLDPVDARFATNPLRVAHRDELIPLIDATFATAPAAEWLPRLAEAGIPAGEVRTMDKVYGWEQTRSQGLLLDVEHATLGTVSLPGPPLRFDDSDGVGRREHRAPPTLGQHNESVRAWLDATAELDAE